MSTPQETLALLIVQQLQHAGHTAYFAGGCVRDRLMNLTPKDFDVATSATPDQVLRLFPRSHEVGAAFGVILVRKKIDDLPLQVEVATFRADGTYSDGRHPDAVRFTSPEEDAQRRDFTCNGLFLDPIANTLHDFVGGQADITAKSLRAIGSPHARFAEDHLRMLRAIRFAARLHFTIDTATFAAIHTLAKNIQTVSKERIHDELSRILTHPARATAAHLLHTSNLLQYILPPELLHTPAAAWPTLTRLPPTTDFPLALLAICIDMHNSTNLHLSGQPLADLLRRDLLLTNTETADLAWLSSSLTLLHTWPTLTKAPLKRLLADPRWPRLHALFTAATSDPASLPPFLACIEQLQTEGVAPPPYITGQSLIKLGVRPSPHFKPWLESLYNRQLENEFPTPAAAIEAARELINQNP